MTTFEEQFPSLKGKATETNSQDFGEGWGYTEETIQDYCLDKQIVERDYVKKDVKLPLTSHCANTGKRFSECHDCKEHKWVYSKEEVVECRDYWIKELDDFKQKVRDAIKTFQDVASSREVDNYTNTEKTLVAIKKFLEKELGL